MTNRIAASLIVYLEAHHLTTSGDSGIIARSQGQVRPEPDGREQT